MTTAELAIGWLAAQTAVSTIIAGATRPEQVLENARAGEVRLSDVALAVESAEQ